ncbi:MAG TPA: hypothetical protein VJ901_12140, partial [Thermoanaerobaculia bacterium]|nr:hypothetical protein [Thermoanaerobaculia bacterium]
MSRDSGQQTADSGPQPSPPLSAIRCLLSRHTFPIATIACIAAALFVPALIHHDVFTFRDHTDYFQPLRFYTAEYLRAWKLPLWNPYNASGEPWLANPQTGVFYPPTWLFIAMPFVTAYMAYLLLHVALLGINAYVLFVRSNTRGAATVGAVALMICGPTVSLWDVSNNFATFAWIPLAIWCGLEHRPRLGGVVLAMAFLGGEPFFAAIAALLFALCVIVSREDGEGPVDRARDTGPSPSARLRMTLEAAAIAFGLSAVQLLPFLELLRASDRRAGLDHETIFKHSMPVREWLRIGLPLHTFDYSLSQHFIPVIYVGVVIVILALVALSVPRKAWPWLVLLAVSAIIAAGNHLPAGEWIARAPVTLFRYPARLVPFGAFAVIALAVIGLDRIPKRRVWVDIVVVLILLIDLVPRTFTLRVVAPLRTDRVPYPAIVGRDLKIIRLGTIPTLNRDAWIPGYLNLYARRFDAMTPAPVASQKYVDTLTHEIVNVGIDHLDAMGVGWLITDRAVPRSRYVLVADGGNARAWRSRGAQPMARVLSYDGVRNVQSLALDASQ